MYISIDRVWHLRPHDHHEHEPAESDHEGGVDQDGLLPALFLLLSLLPHLHPHHRVTEMVDIHQRMHQGKVVTINFVILLHQRNCRLITSSNEKRFAKFKTQENMNLCTQKPNFIKDHIKSKIVLC